MVYLLHQRMLAEELNNLLGVLHMTLYPQGKGFHALQNDEGIERRNSCTGVTQQDCPDVSNKGSRTYCISKGNTMVARVRCSDSRILAACLPIELAGVYNNAAQGSTMTAQELGSGMYHDISTILNRTNQVRSTKGVIDYQRQAVLVGNLCHCLNIRNIAVRIAESFQIYCLGVRLDSGLYLLQVVGIHKGSLDAIARQGMCQQVEAAAVDGLLGNDVVTFPGKSLNSVVNSCSTACHCQACHTALQGSYAALQDTLGRVGQTAIDVACISQAKTGCRMSGISEYIGGSLINRYRSRIGSRIRLLLPNM